MPFLSDGLSVKIPLQGVLKDCSEVFMRMDYFHFFILYLDRPVSVPRSLVLVFTFRTRYDSSHHSVKSSRAVP